MADPLAPLIDELIEVGRDAARRGLVLASAGNLSARLPGGESFVVMHNGKRIEIALDFDLPAAIAGHAPDKPKIREFLPSRADQHISTHPIYECSNEDRDLILAAGDEAVTRHLSSLSDKP